MRLVARRGLLRLRVGRAIVRAEASHRGVVTWAGEATYASLADLTDAIARLAAEPARRCHRLAVVLERPPLQTRTLIDLPPVKHRELRALVAHQAARYFRKNGHPLVTDAIWAGAGTGHVAHAAAVEEPVVEAIVAGARTAGLTLEAIAPADSLLPLRFLPTSDRAVRARAARGRVRRLGLVTAGVWMVAMGLFVGRLVWERRVVERQLGRLEAPLAAVLAARHELRDAEATLQAVAGADRARGQALAALRALTAALPDSAVVTSLTWSAGDSGVVTGSARRAADVLARLERASEFPDVRLEGPVVLEAIAGRAWERFTIVYGGERGRP
jgi:hypothetical protein